MAVHSSYILVMVICVLPCLAKHPLSHYTNICNAKDPKLNDCVLTAATKFLPVLSEGIKEYGMPSIDPLVVPKMVVGQDTGPVTIKFVMTNSKQSGLSKIKLEYASVDLKKGVWIINGTVPEYRVEGKYETKGKILVLPIVGEGQCVFTLHKLTLGIVIQGKPTNIKDKTFFKISKTRVYFNNLDHVTSHLNNLFNGNKALGDQMNAFLNENNREISGYLQSSLEDVYSALFGALIERLIASVPYDQLFKDV